MAEIRRITSTVGTIPDNTALAGTVTSNTDTTVLTYSGSNDIAEIMAGGKLGENSTIWIYVPAATPKIAKVKGVYKNSNNNWSIFLDRAMTGASSSASNYVKAPITYSWTNDGGGDATINGVTVHDGEFNTAPPYQPYSNRSKFHDVLYVDASSTSILITNEET